MKQLSRKKIEFLDSALNHYHGKVGEEGIRTERDLYAYDI